MRGLGWLRVGLWLLVLALFCHARAYSTNETSRLASIEALVQRGTWAITQSPFATIDRIQVGAEFYSDKPPMLALLGAGLYAPLHYGLGWTLQPTLCNADLAPAHCRALWLWPETDWAYVVLTLGLVALPGAVLLELYYRLARRKGWPAAPAWALATVLGFGTSLFPYGTVFTNHVPAAAATFAALYLLLGQSLTKTRLALAGMLAMLSATFDLSTGIFVLGLGVYALWTQRHLAFWFVGGAVCPLALAVFLNLQITGLPWPPQMYPAGYDYPGSAFGATVAGNATASDVGRYVFALLLGERGLLMFYPVVFVYLWAIGRALWRGHLLAWGIALASLGYFAYFALFTNNFGGYAYSPRWLLNPLPLLAVFVLDGRELWAAWSKRLLFAALAGFSIFSAYWGALNPWQPARPLVYLQTVAPQPAAQPAVMIAGYSSFYEVPAALRQGVWANQVVPRVFEAQQGWVVPPGPAWWFVRGTAVPMFLETAVDTATLADLRPAAEGWLAQAQTNITPFVPSATPTLLPLTFGGQQTLLGFTLKVENDQAVLTTAWRWEQPSPVQRRVFAHLVSVHGPRVQQSDAWPAENSTLQVGDWVFLIQRLPLAEVPPDTYQVLIGIYEPITGERLYTPKGWDTLVMGEITKNPNPSPPQTNPSR